MPGMGKTTSNINILIQLSERDIPFIVFESAKSEYRVLKKFKRHKKTSIRKLAKELRIFTAGNEKTSCFRFNPLRIPPGIGVDEHIENLLACFKAAFHTETKNSTITTFEVLLCKFMGWMVFKTWVVHPFNKRV